jgi:hypothetical protein
MTDYIDLAKETRNVALRHDDSKEVEYQDYSVKILGTNDNDKVKKDSLVFICRAIFSVPLQLNEHPSTTFDLLLDFLEF